VSLDDDDYGTYDEGSGDESLEKISDARESDVEDDESIDDDGRTEGKNKTVTKIDDIAFDDEDDDDGDVDDDEDDDIDEEDEDIDVNEEVSTLFQFELIKHFQL